MNHTNIAAIHGLEEADGTKFLVLTPEPKVGSQAPYRREETFKLEKAKGAAWVIREWSQNLLK